MQDEMRRGHHRNSIHIIVRKGRKSREGGIYIIFLQRKIQFQLKL